MSMLHYRNGIGGFKQPTPQMPARITGSVAADDERGLTSLYRQYESLKEQDMQKDKFITVRYLSLPTPRHH